MENIKTHKLCMPEEYKGKDHLGSRYKKTNPRGWTDEEVNWLVEKFDEGYSLKEIAEGMGRSETSVSIKRKRINKDRKKYNKNHVDDKYEINRRFLKYIKPETVLDLYAGECFYREEGVSSVTNDISSEFNTDYHEDALRLICKLYYDKKKFDIVDLDPFGSAYDCFDLAIKMANKGIIITMGELGHKRWKRLDFVRAHYGINSVEDFTMDNIISHIQMIGRRNKKKLSVWAKKEWFQIGRVWFAIEPLKVVEQWSKDGS